MSFCVLLFVFHTRCFVYFYYDPYPYFMILIEKNSDITRMFSIFFVSKYIYLPPILLRSPNLVFSRTPPPPHPPTPMLFHNPPNCAQQNFYLNLTCDLTHPTQPTFHALFFMHFCPGTITTHAESINSDLQRGLDRRLQHIQH